MKPTDPPDDDRLPIVPFCPFRCPRCKAAKPKTYKVLQRLRYHRCQHCGTKYRSVELNPTELHTWHAAPVSDG